MSTLETPTPRTRPRIVGHRGAALREPENTLRSFRRALADGARILECDVHLSADGHVVVMHDPSIDRTAAADSPLRTGAIRDLTRAQLDEVRLEKGESVPSLSQLLAVLEEAEPSPQLLVEVKAHQAATAVAREAAGRQDVRVISFHPEALRAVREMAPTIPLGLIVESVGEGTLDLAARLEVAMLAVSVDRIGARDVTQARARGLEVNVWTANSEAQVRRGIEVGADTITSDDPGWAIALADAEGA